MSFDPIGFVFPKSNIPEGGAGYTETTKTVLLDGVFEVRIVEPGVAGFETEVLDIKGGDQLLVNWNGKQYTSVVFDIGSISGFGNLAIIGFGDDTGEPFIYLPGTMDGNVEGQVVTTNAPGTVTFTVVSKTETVHPIDPKYLPIKVIDLDQYGIGEAIIGLFAQDGGQVELQDTDAFWGALGDDTNVDVRMYLNYRGTVLELCGVSKAHNGNGRWLQLSASILTLADSLENIPLLYVAIIRSGDDSVVAVRVS